MNDFPIHREVQLLFCYSMLYDYNTNLLIPNPVVILTDDLAGGVFELKRFHCAGGEEILNEFSDGIYEVILIMHRFKVYFRHSYPASWINYRCIRTFLFLIFLSNISLVL